MLKIGREADDYPVTEVAKQHDITGQTSYGWRKRYRALETADMRRLPELARRKKLVAECDLEVDALNAIARGQS